MKDNLRMTHIVLRPSTQPLMYIGMLDDPASAP